MMRSEENYCTIYIILVWEANITFEVPEFYI